MTDAAPGAARLTYFGFRGLGEPIRLVFADLALPLDERRLGFDDDWAALKPRLPFRQMPVFEAGGLTVVQSHAILRHLARIHGLYGPDETARIRADATADAVKDAQNALWDYFWAPEPETAEAARAFATGRLAENLAQLEGWLASGPYFAGAAPTFADYYALTYLDEAAAYFPEALEAAPGLAAFRTRMWARPGLAAYAASGRQPQALGFDPTRGMRLGRR
jgi:glutathione S-transferase